LGSGLEKVQTFLVRPARIVDDMTNALNNPK